MSLARTVILKTSGLAPIKYLVRRTFFFRPLVSRFIAGDTLEEALKASEVILSKGLKVSLDYLGENTASEQEALEAKATYIKMLERIAEVPQVKAWNAAHQNLKEVNQEGAGIEPLNISIKLTQCGLDQGTEFAERNFRDVLATAKKLSNFVRVDMEASEYTERTMEMIERVRADFPNTSTVLQTYLYRTPADVEKISDQYLDRRFFVGRRIGLLAFVAAAVSRRPGDRSACLQRRQISRGGQRISSGCRACVACS